MRRSITSLLFRFFLNKSTIQHEKQVAPARDLDAFHESTPETDEDLRQCWSRVRAQLQTDASWSAARLGLYFRTVCTPPALYLAGLARMSQHLDVSCMQVLDSGKEPTLAATMDFATRAGQASLLLYRRTPGALGPQELAEQEQAQTHFMASVVDLANRGVHHTSTDDLRFLALAATFRRGASAPGRDWTLLLAEEPRWCLAAFPQVRPALMQAHPQTASYFREFDMLRELVPTLDALHRVWYPPGEDESTVYALPDGAAL